MPSALSVDLRESVIAAGASRRQAAKRFGIGPSSAIRWHERFQAERAIAPRSSSGQRPAPAIEAHAKRILQIDWEQPQAFLHEVRDTLAEQGVRTGFSGLWRFFARHRITRKKGLSTRPSSSGRT
jgi:transposase